MLEKFQDKTAADIYGVEHLLRLFGMKPTIRVQEYN